MEIGGGALQSHGATSSITTDEAGAKFLNLSSYCIILCYIVLYCIVFLHFYFVKNIGHSGEHVQLSLKQTPADTRGKTLI